MVDVFFISPTAIVMFTVAILQQATIKPSNIIAHFMRNPKLVHILVMSAIFINL